GGNANPLPHLGAREKKGDNRHSPQWCQRSGACFGRRREVDHATADRLPWADSSRPNDRIEQARRAQPTSSSPGYLLSLASSAILASSPQHFQPWQGAGAAAELVHLQSEALEHRDKEVAQRRVA